MPQVVLMTEEAVWTDAETFPLRQMMRAKQIPQIAGKFDFQQIIFLFQKPGRNGDAVWMPQHNAELPAVQANSGGIGEKFTATQN